MASTRERNGRYVGLYDVYAGGKRKQRSAGTYGTQEEAYAHAVLKEKAARPDPAAKMIDLPAEKRGRITVAGYFGGWLENHRLEPTSRASYEAAGKHIIRELGRVPVGDLDDDKCAKFLRKLETSGLKSATIGNIRTVLRGMCRAAVKAGTLDAVPDMEIAPIHSREMMIATRAQAASIQEAIPEPYKLLVETLFATGMRYGEAMGLGEEHVVLNATHAVLKVGRRTITEVGGKGTIKFGGKTQNARRDVVIPRELGERLIANARNGFIFRAPRCGYLNRASFRRPWKTACMAAGVPDLRVHDARHSACSWWVNEGKPLSAVMKRMGHSSLAVTSRYTHDMSAPELWGEAA